MKFLFLAWKHPVEPLGLLYISAILKKDNHKTKIAVIGQDDLTKVVQDFKPNVVAGSVMTGGQTEFLRITNELKQHHNFLTLMGGSHPTFHPQVLKEEGMDIVAQGECEEAIVEFANNYEQGKDYTKIQNLWIKKDGKIYKNEIRNLNENLDTLPFPDRDVAYEHKIWKDEPIRHFIACRGCSYKCQYCFNSAIDKIYGGKGKWVRWRSVDNLIAEIKEVFQKYGGKFVYFQDDIFVMNKPWLKEFAEKYRKEINLPFHCHVRPNNIDENTARLLSEAGCYSVHMALEAADDYIRNVIIKREMDKETVYKASDLLHKYGIKIMLQNILGLPESSLETDLETLKMNIKCKPLYAWCSIFQPYPGLPLTEYAISRNLLEGDFDDIGPKFFETTVVKLENKKQIEYLQKWFAVASAYPFIYKTGLLKLILNMPDNKHIKNLYKFIYNKFRNHKDNQLYGIKLSSAA
ncbi:B12-binding domain-containing radical SAM protein [Candidatus Woesearchaeota archaeon]|nr:B12-binding domain-containing radical SAM protein [Candidatus Woesearchaeota archaeon]